MSDWPWTRRLIKLKLLAQDGGMSRVESYPDSFAHQFLPVFAVTVILVH